MIQNKILLSIFAAVFYVFNLFWVARQYYIGFLSGDYPPKADSIGLPIGLYFITWLLGLPILALVLTSIWKSNMGGASLFGFNRNRPFRSIVIYLAAVFMVSWDVFYIIEQAPALDLIGFLYLGFEVYLILCFRVVFTFLGEKPPAEMKN